MRSHNTRKDLRNTSVVVADAASGRRKRCRRPEEALTRERERSRRGVNEAIFARPHTFCGGVKYVSRVVIYHK